MASDIEGYWFTDDDTRKAMTVLQDKYNYQADPHGAVAFAGLQESGMLAGNTGIFLETAHPAKFPEEVEKATKTAVQIPDPLKEVMKREKQSVKTENKYENLADILRQM